MDLWGEIEDEPIDKKYQELIQKSLPKIVNPSEFKHDHQQRFHSNPLLCKHCNMTNFHIDKCSKNEKMGPFFEILKILVSNHKQQKITEHYQNKHIPMDNTESVVAKSMRDSIIMILTFAGFDFANDTAVDLLVDILEYYLKSFGKLLRTFTDSIDLQSPNDFYDIVDKTLHHMNVPDFETLFEYHKKIVEYNDRIKIESNCKEDMLNKNKKIKSNH